MDSDTAPSQRVPAEAPKQERLSRSATLLILLQGLATLGKILLRTVQRNDTRPAERIEVYTRFATRNVALIVARFQRVGTALMPIAIAANAVPIIAFAPIFNAWFDPLQRAQRQRPLAHMQRTRASQSLFQTCSRR